MYPRARPLKNIRKSNRWIKLLRLRWLKWIWTGNVRMKNLWLARPMTPQALREGMQRIDGLVTERWT